MKEQGLSFRLSDSVRIAVRCGLLAAPLVFLLEAAWIFGTAGGFLRHSLDLPMALTRYVAYGAILGLVIAVVSHFLVRRVSRGTMGSFFLSFIVGIFFAIEIGFYVLDIVVHWGSTPRLRILLLVGAVLVSALGIAAAIFFAAQRLGGRLDRFLNALAWPRFLSFCALEVSVVFLVAHFSAVLATNLAASGSPGVRRPNVVLIVLDTVRADALSSSGNSLANTPYLDQLASEGVRFSRATSASTWTPPGHASLFTGLYPLSHGTRGMNTALARDLDVLPSILNQMGYITVSLYNNPLVGRGNAMDRGFDFSIGVETDTKVSFIDQRLYYKYGLKDSGVLETCELLYAWVKEHDRRGAPWLAFVNLLDAHLPYIPREPWMGEFLNRLGVEVDKVDQRAVWRAMSGRTGIQEFQSGKLILSDRELAWLRAAYYSEVRAIDQYLGDTFERMRRERLLDDTIVIITSDHGEAIGEEGMLGHGNGLLASVVRIPLIFWAPGRLEPRIDDRWASLVDVLPTLLDITGIEYTPNSYHFAGKSLLRDDKPDETIVEDYSGSDGHGCDSFLLLRGREGIRLGCDGEATLLEIPEDSLISWGDIPQDVTRINQLRDDLISWRDASLANYEPGATENRIETDPRLREQLRTLGYID